MSIKTYKYGNDKLPIKVLKNLHEVIDFVNPRNENLKQSTIRQRIVASLNNCILYPGAKSDPNRWKPVQARNGKKRITVAQRIERQPHLKKHLDPNNTLKPKSIISKYYRLRKKGQLPAHEENPSESVFKNVSVDRKNKAHIARYQQEIPKTVDFESYWKIHKEQILRRCNEYPVSKIKCVMKIRMQKAKLKDFNEVFPFESEIHIVTDGTDMDKLFDTIRRQIFESVVKFMKNGSGWTIVNLEIFDINIYEYKPFSGSTHIKFRDIKVKFKGKKMDLDKELSGRKAIINMQNNDNECFKWYVVRALNPVKDNPQRITKELRKQAEEYDWSEIPFPTPYEDNSVKRFEVKYGMSINVYGFRWELKEDERAPKLEIFPLRLSALDGKEVNLFYVREERDSLDDEYEIKNERKEFEIVSHYCVITSLSRLLSSTVRKDNNGKAYICRKCCNSFKSQKDLDKHVPCMSTSFDRYPKPGTF